MRVVVYEATRAGRRGDPDRAARRLSRRAGAELAWPTPPPPLRALLGELGLEASLVPASPAARNRYVVRRRTGCCALPMSPQDLLTTRLLSNGAKLAVFGEPLVDAGDSPVEESVATFVRRRFNQEILDYVANPFVAGIFAGDPEQLSVRHALPKLYGLERTHGSVMKAFGGMMRARKRDDDAAGAAAAGADLVPRRPAGAARRARPASSTPRSGSGRRSPSSARGPRGGRSAPHTRRPSSTTRVVYAAPAHCLDEIDLDFPAGDRRQDARQHRPPAGRGAGARLPAGRRGPSARRLRLPGARGRAPARARRDLLVHALPRARARRATYCSRRSSAASANPDLAHADLPTLTARVHGRPPRAARRQGRAHLPRLPALAQGHSAVRPQLRPVQGDHGRGGAAESRTRAGRVLPRRGGAGRGDRLGRRGGRRELAADLPAGRRGVRRPDEPRRSASAPAAARWRSGRPSRSAPGSGAAGYATERVEIRTTGDLVQHVPLARIGSRALFTRQIDDAMLEGRIDLAVHSLKDLPTELPDGIALAAVGEREDPRDALVGRGPLAWTRAAARAPCSRPAASGGGRSCSTSGPTCRSCDIRGNVDTRLAKLDATPEWTGILLATAGLVRLGLGGPDRRAAAPRGHAARRRGRARSRSPRALATPRPRPPPRGRSTIRPTALAVAAERAFLRRARRRMPGAGGGLRGARRRGGRAAPAARAGRVARRGARRSKGVEPAPCRDEAAGGRARRRAGRAAAGARAPRTILAEVRAAAAPVVPEP